MYVSKLTKIYSLKRQKCAFVFESKPVVYISYNMHLVYAIIFKIVHTFSVKTVTFAE